MDMEVIQDHLQIDEIICVDGIMSHYIIEVEKIGQTLGHF